MNIYAIKDKACGIIHIFTANNEKAAKRSMAETMEGHKGDLIYRYSEDFDVLDLGELNSDTGAIDQTKVKFVANLESLKRKD